MSEDNIFFEDNTTQPAETEILDQENKTQQKKTEKEWKRWVSLLFFPLAISYWEIILRFASNLEHEILLGTIIIAIGAGCIFTLLSSLTKNPKINGWIGFVFTELLAIIFLVEYFTNNAYTVFMSPSSIITGVGGVVTEFGDYVVAIIKNGFGIILLYEIPAAVDIVLMFFSGITRFKRIDIRQLIVLVATFIVCEVGGTTLFVYDKADLKKYTSEYEYDTSVRTFGLLPSLKIDIGYLIFGNKYADSFDFDPIPVIIETPSDVTPENTSTDVEKPIEYGYNVTELNFDELAGKMSNSTTQQMLSYVQSIAPSKQNKYTGLFKGKNLIMITAEAFTAEVIDPVRTPTLYRMANKGICFKEFYQPAWGGSTSTGEISFLTGIAPTNGVSSIQQSVGWNYYYTMGNQLHRVGYTGNAYHNGMYTFYKRNETHVGLGYDDFIARGHGLEERMPSKQYSSDNQFFIDTVGDYIDKQPFSVYYMTISGHCAYYPSNLLAANNWSVVKDMEASSFVKAYYAQQQELENAMTSLISALEEAGIADDTVIAICADHYPYGLTASEAWGTTEDYLPELYGVKTYDRRIRDHNALIIWSGVLEDMDPIVVNEPTYSLDVVPTLSNLFGLEYDSRFLVGRDVFSDQIPLVLWVDRSWITDKGYYNSYTGKFTPNEGVEVPEDYVDNISKIVSNKLKYSKGIWENDFFGDIYGKIAQ